MSISSFLDQVVLVGFFGLIIFAAISDISAYRIPNKICIGLVALFPVHVIVSPAPVNWLSALLVAAAVFLVGFVLFARGLVGAGDVKLLSATALWAGRPLIGQELVVMALLGGVLGAALMLVQVGRRYRAVGLVGMLAGSGGPSAVAEPAPKLPYGIAIAAGALYAGLQLLPG